jgi:hypothetical protein
LTAHARYFAGRENDILALWDSPRQREAYTWFTTELTNLRTAFRWAADQGDLDVAAPIATYAAWVGLLTENYEPIAWAGSPEAELASMPTPGRRTAMRRSDRAVEVVASLFRDGFQFCSDLVAPRCSLDVLKRRAVPKTFLKRGKVSIGCSQGERVLGHPEIRRGRIRPGFPVLRSGADRRGRRLPAIRTAAGLRIADYLCPAGPAAETNPLTRTKSTRENKTT